MNDAHFKNAIMVDLETLSTEDNPVISSIGAVRFNALTGEIGERFYVTVDIKDAQNHGLHLDADTVLWWLKQDKGVIHSTFGSGTELRLEDALSLFSKFFFTTKAETVGLWSHSQDQIWLTNAYKAVGFIGAPWAYNQGLELRTIFETAKLLGYDWDSVDIPRTLAAKHNSLADALYQAQRMSSAVQFMLKGGAS